MAVHNPSDRHPGGTVVGIAVSVVGENRVRENRRNGRLVEHRALGVVGYIVPVEGSNLEVEVCHIRGIADEVEGAGHIQAVGSLP